MGLGILEDVALERVPGTVFLNEAGVGSLELATGSPGIGMTPGLKHSNNIVLVPQVKKCLGVTLYQFGA
jgi:hypothetical protein